MKMSERYRATADVIRSNPEYAALMFEIKGVIEMEEAFFWKMRWLTVLQLALFALNWWLFGINDDSAIRWLNFGAALFSVGQIMWMATDAHKMYRERDAWLASMNLNRKMFN